MTADFPHTYEASVSWNGAYPSFVSSGERRAVSAGPPPQFGGEGAWWSPEHLLLSSANLCLMTTYLALAAKAQLKVLGYEGKATGTLNKTKEGIVFTRLRIAVSLRTAPEDSERAEKLLATAKKYCSVSNSLRVPVEVELTARVPAP